MLARWSTSDPVTQITGPANKRKDKAQGEEINSRPWDWR